MFLYTFIYVNVKISESNTISYQFSVKCSLTLSSHLENEDKNSHLPGWLGRLSSCVQKHQTLALFTQKMINKWWVLLLSRVVGLSLFTESQRDKEIRGETTSKKLRWFKQEMATVCVTLGRLPNHCDPQFYHPFWQ